jgi:hypothetical protein
MDVRDCSERQRVGAGAAVRLGSDGATAHGGFRLVRARVRARVKGRERSWEEMEALRKQASKFKEQVAKQQQVRIPSRTPDSSFRLSVLYCCRCA